MPRCRGDIGQADIADGPDRDGEAQDSGSKNADPAPEVQRLAPALGALKNRSTKRITPGTKRGRIRRWS